MSVLVTITKKLLHEKHLLPQSDEEKRNALRMLCFVPYSCAVGDIPYTCRDMIVPIPPVSVTSLAKQYHSKIFFFTLSL